MAERLLSTATAAETLGVSPSTLEGWRVRGGGPPYVKVAGRVVRYRPSDLDKWVAARVFGSTTEADEAARRPRPRRAPVASGDAA